MSGTGDPPGDASKARVAAAVVVSLLVTISGASAVGGVAELAASNGDALESLTSDEPQQATQQQFPPGTNESGVTNATALLEAHERALQNTSHAARGTTEEARFVPNGNQSGGEWSVDEIALAVEKGPAGTNLNVTAGGDHAEYWVTENATATSSVQSRQNASSVQYVYDESGMFGQTDDSAFLETAPTLVVSRYVESVDYDYRGSATQGNETLYEFVSTGVNRSDGDGPSARLPPTVENVSATLLVSERGVIHEFDATVEHAHENETVTTRTTYSVSDLGDTTTSEPAWLGEQLPRFDASLTENGSVVALEFTGGRDPANGTQAARVGVWSPNVESHGNLTTPLAPGDTVYVWSTNESARLGVSVNDPPSVNDSFVPFGGERVGYTASRVQTGTESNWTTDSVSIQLWVPPETGPQNATVMQNLTAERERQSEWSALL